MIVNTVFPGNSRSELTKIDGMACTNIAEVVNKFVFQPAWAILVKLGEINMIPLIILNKNQRFITG